MGILICCMFFSQIFLICEALPLEEVTDVPHYEDFEHDADNLPMWYETVDDRLVLTMENIMLLKESCPNLQNETDNSIIQYRIDQDSKNCHWLGGECGRNMFFYFKEKGDVHGICDCSPYGQRAMVYDAGSNSCEPVYSRGSCTTGQYLAVDSKGRAGCIVNPCLKDGQVMFNGSCSTIGDPKPCETESNNSYEQGQTLEIVDLEIQCLSPHGSGGSSASHVQKLPCKAGSKFSTSHGKCFEEAKMTAQIG